MRDQSGGCIFNKKIYPGEIYSVAFSPKNEYTLAAAGSAKNIGLWDMRNMSGELFSLEGHTDDVNTPSDSGDKDPMVAHIAKPPVVQRRR